MFYDNGNIITFINETIYKCLIKLNSDNFLLIPLLMWLYSISNSVFLREILRLRLT